jgi:hypothetical protein
MRLEVSNRVSNRKATLCGLGARLCCVVVMNPGATLCGLGAMLCGLKSVILESLCAVLEPVNAA